MRLLAIDVGNTNAKIGVFDGDEIVCRGRLHTAKEETELDYLMRLRDFLEINKVTGIDGAIISCVVPAITGVLTECIKMLCNIDPLVVKSTMETGIKIDLDTPDIIGADLITSDVAAVNKYPLPAVVFCFGTATTASVIDRNRTHIGGIIACGVKTGITALAGNASLLPDVEPTPPRKIIAKGTVDALRSGSIVGAAAMMEGFVSRFEKEIGEKLTVIVTGGLGKFIAQATTLDVIVDDDLILEGLRILYEKNHK